ncbi:hypothetical protein LguiA_002300 [Lonicera macranthoides]
METKKEKEKEKKRNHWRTSANKKNYVVQTLDYLAFLLEGIIVYQVSVLIMLFYIFFR